MRGGALPLGGLDVRIVELALVRLAPVLHMVYADRGQDACHAPNVVFMVVADDQVVELPDAKLVVVRDRLVAVPADHVPADVERDGLATRRDQDRPVALADIDEV